MPAHVTLYVKAGCPHCDAARAALVLRGAAFTEIDVGAQPEVVPELLKLTRGKRIVPVVVEGARIDVAGRGGSPF
jgi:glutaredoxin 3